MSIRHSTGIVIRMTTPAPSVPGGDETPVKPRLVTPSDVTISIRLTRLAVLFEWLQPGVGSESAARDTDVLNAIRGHLTSAEQALQRRSRAGRVKRLRLDWSGLELERAVANLDAAEGDLLLIAPLGYVRGQIPELLASVEERLSLGDPRRVEVERLVRQLEDRNPTETERHVLLSAIREGTQVEARDRARIRSFRNVLVIATTLMLLGALGLLILGAVAPRAVPICFPVDADMICPSGVSRPSSSHSGGDVADVAVVEILGALGGALAASASLRQMRGTSLPFGLPLWLALLKPPVGACTAVMGLVLLRGQFIPGFGHLESQAQIMAYALVFGYAQQLFTHPVDQQAQTLLTSAAGHTTSGTPAEYNRDALHSAVVTTLQSSLASPRLVNYDGTLSLSIVDSVGNTVDTDSDGRFVVGHGGQRLFAALGPAVGEESYRQVSVRIRDGDPAERVPFTIGVVGDIASTASEEYEVELVGPRASANVELPLELTKEIGAAKVWVRLAQRGTLIQLVEVKLTSA
jgi:hypothetical protein